MLRCAGRTGCVELMVFFDAGGCEEARAKERDVRRVHAAGRPRVDGPRRRAWLAAELHEGRRRVPVPRRRAVRALSVLFSLPRLPRLTPAQEPAYVPDLLTGRAGVEQAGRGAAAQRAQHAVGRRVAG